MSLPDVSEAFWDWTSASKFQVVTPAAVDFEVEEGLSTEATFDGVLQPMPPQRLLIKPEGQRNWIWWTLWTKKDLKLNDIVTDGNGKVFRVLSKSNWLQGGYFEYELAENNV